MNIDFYTSGVYGSDAGQFFEKLISNKIDTFIDIRRRRAVRGSRYAFANSNRLQARLKELGINYIHIDDLSPTVEIISIQKKSDKASGTKQSERERLDDKFVTEYKRDILDKYDFTNLINKLEKLNTRRALFFCVEANPKACHRSIITARMESLYSVRVQHL